MRKKDDGNYFGIVYGYCFEKIGLTFSLPASRRRDLQHAGFPRGISRKSTTKSHFVRKIRTE
jgi:hypothetical protein